METTLRRGRARRGFFALFSGLLAVILGFALFPSVGRATGTPSVTFSQASGLRDGQVVTVRFSGFTPGDEIFIRQCAHTNATDAEPNLANSEPVTNTDCGNGLAAIQADDNGNGLAYYPVIVTIGTGNSVPGDANMICGATQDCFLSVMLRSQLRTPGAASGLQRLVFAADPNSCPQAGQTVLSGGGSGAVSTVMPDWQIGVCPVPDRTTLDYVATKGDAGGRQDFLCGLRAFAITETPGSADESCFLNGAKRPHVFVPVANNSLVFAYNLRDKITHQHIEDLKLTPSMLAWVFTGQALSWSSYSQNDLHDAQIAALNSNHVLPNNIQVIGRADQSSLNYLLTRFFITRSKEALWAGGPNFQMDAPTEFYPAAQGLSLMTTPQAVANALSQNDDTDGVMGWIGVMDAATAAYYGLPTVAIGSTSDPSTATFVSSTPESVAKGLALMTDSGQGTMEANVWPADSSAYPLPFTAYAELPTDSSLDQSEVNSATAWLKYVKNQTTLPQGYVALSDPQKSALTASLTKFAIQPKVTPTPTPSSTSTETPSAPFTPIDSGVTVPSDPLLTDTSGTSTSSDPAAVATAPVSIFAEAVSTKSTFSTAFLLLLIAAGIGATGVGAWQLTWGSKK